MKKLVAVGALGLMASCLFAQGQNLGGQTKDDWEEINFEFNSSILSDGFPSLLRLAELLTQHKDYRVTITGHTDYVGSAQYNDRLALARANTVRDFLVKYGAAANQISTNGQGKRNPEVNNATNEGRFMNRRVVLSVADGQGRVIKEGTVREVLNAIPQQAQQPPAAGGLPNDCCNQILRRLDKLDEILAQLKNLQGDNDKLRGEVADLRNQQNTLRDQMAGIPKPLTEQQTTTIAHNEAQGAVDEAQRRNKKFSILGIDVGPTYGPAGRGKYTYSGRAQFFSPFGGDGTHAVQAQGEYMYYPGRQEGQFDIGLVNRWGHFQAGGFGSFKVLSFREYQNAGFLGQGSFLFDYIFGRGRIGGFATKGFKNVAVLNETALGPSSFLQTYARIVDQFGVNALVGVWGDASLEGNLAYLRRNVAGADKPGLNVKLVQPINPRIAFTAEVGLDETLVTEQNRGRVVFGLQFGNFIRPKDYGTTNTPVPMDVPRIRYQLLTRRVGNSAPVADAGPDQLGVAAGAITLDGSASYDPDGDTLTYSWQQIGGANVSLTGANAAKATFTAAAGQTYVFRLTVKDPGNLQGTARTTVTTSAAPTAIHIDQFSASPTNIQSGQTATLTWAVTGASSVNIVPGIGNVNAQSGTTQVSPEQTTTYTLTATGPGGTVNSTAVVTVNSAPAPAQIIRFDASPTTVQQGAQATLSWTTSNASQVSITGIGNVTPNGSTTVTPQQTTTYTLTAVGADGRAVTSPVTITVTPPPSTGQVQILSFTSDPVTSTAAGNPVTLSWSTQNATSVILVGQDIASQTLPVNGSLMVHPTTNTTYTLTAYGSNGQAVSVTISVFVR